MITFAALHTDRIRLDLTSAAPDSAAGAQRITSLAVSPE